MKRLMYLTICLPLAWLTACDVHEWPDEKKAQQTVRLYLDFDDDMPLHHVVEPAVRSVSAEEACDLRYTVRAYRAEGPQGFGREECARLVVTKSDIAIPDHSVELTLDEGLYKFIVWADYVDAGGQEHKFYDTDDFERVCLCGEEHRGNTHLRDAFRGSAEARIPAGSSAEVHVAMERPLARYHFVATDLDRFLARTLSKGNGKAADLSDYRVVFHYTGFMPSAFNMFTDAPCEAATGVSFEGSLSRTDAGEAELGFDYVFVNGSEATVQVAVRIYDSGGRLISGTNTIDVPLTRSKYTVVRGRFLTSEASGDIGINPDFDGEWNYEVK